MFYILHGKDEYSKKKALGTLRGRLGDPGMMELNTAVFEKPPTFTMLRQACDAVPFLTKSRLVIVHNLLSSKPSKEMIKSLKAYLPILPDSSKLVFMETGDVRSNGIIAKLAKSAENGYIKKYEPLNAGQVSRWIMKYVERENGRISPHAAHILAVDTEGSLQILSNELDKLLMYKNGETIESDDVTLLSPYVAEANIFDLVDTIGNRNSKGAALLLDKKLREGTEPFYLFAMIIRQFRLLIQVKETAVDGRRAPAVAKELRMHKFVAGKMIQQSSHFSMTQLEQIYRHLLDIDIGVKTGKNNMVTALSLLLATLTAVP